MPRFFVPSEAIAAGRATITGADAAHLARSLRARPGETIVVVDEAAMEHGVRLEEIGVERCAGDVLWSRPSMAEPRLAVTVLQAIPQQGMEDAIDAMVQVGVHAIAPVESARGVVRLEAGRRARRVERWRAVAREAAGQAGRGRVPRVKEIAPLADAVAALQPGGVLLAAVPGATEALTAVRVDPAVPVAIAIGPEGGFDGAELDHLRAAGAAEAHLGPRIVRSRLAGAIATSVLLALCGDLSGGPAREERA